MQFRFRDKSGRVVSLPDVASLLQAIQSGAITAKTSLAVGNERGWHRAQSVAAYREAVAALKRGMVAPPPSAGPDWSQAAGRGGSSSRNAPPRINRPSGRMVAAAVAVLLFAAVFGVRPWLNGQRRQARPAPAAPAVTGLRAQSRLRAFSFQFGDSVALERRRLEEWLASQRYTARLRGSALKSPVSLQIARTTSAGYLVRLDRLVSSREALAQRLVARADSLEGAEGTAGGGFEGLATALEDEIAVWSREFTTHEEILRALAAAMDSLPAFVLGKQASFAMRDGAPVFLSRDDAARFAVLEEHFSALANRERAWSDALLARRPDWMSGLIEDDRPEFGRSVLASR